jgi:hypothetical protein
VDRITTTIEREWLAEIIAGTKMVEYREVKPYWRERLAKVSVPFELRLINGMQAHAPEVTVVVDRVRRNSQLRRYELRIRKVVSYSNWDIRRRVPRVSRSRRRAPPGRA